MIGGLALWRREVDEIVSSWRDDVLIISYPKSGRTWHRVMLGKYLELLFKIAPTHQLKTRRLTRALRLPRVSYTNNGANFAHAIPPYHVLNGQSALWRRRRVIMLVREPKDVLVSAYFHARYRINSFTGTLPEFIRHPYTGIEKLLVAHQRWFDYQRIASSVLLHRYETTHTDPEATMRSTLDFIGIKIDAECLAAAVEFGRFDNMKKLERQGYFESNAMQSDPAAGEAGQKVREGRVGGHGAHLNAEDIDYIDLMIARIGYPFAPTLAHCDDRQHRAEAVLER